MTTSQPHGYFDGAYIRIDMAPDPDLFGMTQVAGNVYLITIIDTTSFSIGVDTSSFDAFTYFTHPQACQCIPVGEVALSLLSAEKNTLTPFGG